MIKEDWIINDWWPCNFITVCSDFCLSPFRAHPWVSYQKFTLKFRWLDCREPDSVWKVCSSLKNLYRTLNAVTATVTETSAKGSSSSFRLCPSPFILLSPFHHLSPSQFHQLLPFFVWQKKRKAKAKWRIDERGKSVGQNFGKRTRMSCCSRILGSVQWFGNFLGEDCFDNPSIGAPEWYWKNLSNIESFVQKRQHVCALTVAVWECSKSKRLLYLGGWKACTYLSTRKHFILLDTLTWVTWWSCPKKMFRYLPRD